MSSPASEQPTTEVAIEDFLLLATHQLRTPLTTLRWQAESLLNRTDLTPEVKVGLQKIDSAVARLIALTNTLLDTARLETGKEVVNKTNVALASVLAEVVESLEPQAAQKTLRIAVECPPELTAHADAKLLSRAYENLLHNAITYSYEHSVITTKVEVLSPTMLRVTVIDYGAIIHDDEKERLFSRFYRGRDAQSSAPSTHSGLGLFIAKNAVESNGGVLTLDYSNENGTAFSFTVPRV